MMEQRKKFERELARRDAEFTAKRLAELEQERMNLDQRIEQLKAELADLTKDASEP